MSLTNLETIRNPQLRRLMQEKFEFKSVTATAVAIAANRLVETTGATIQAGTDDSAAILGANLKGNIESAGTADIDWGMVEVLASGDFAIFDGVSAAAGGRVRKYLSAQGTILAATAGGNFANQPAGDTIDVVSDAAGDTTQTATIYYTTAALPAVVSSEVMTLNGTTPVLSVATPAHVLAIVLSASCAGTLTFAETSGSQTIITITTGILSLGFNATTAPDAYGTIPTIKGDGASTTWAGVIGVGVDGAALTAAVATNGTTDVNLGGTPFDTITTVLIGGVASTVDAITETKAADTNRIGIAAAAGTSGSVSKVYIQPYGI